MPLRFLVFGLVSIVFLAGAYWYLASRLAAGLPKGLRTVVWVGMAALFLIFPAGMGLGRADGLGAWADDDRSGTDDQDALEIGPARHGRILQKAPGT